MVCEQCKTNKDAIHGNECDVTEAGACDLGDCFVCRWVEAHQFITALVWHCGLFGWSQLSALDWVGSLDLFL